MGYYVKDYDVALWERARQTAEAMPIYGNSHRESAANQVGALGEVVFENLLDHFGIPFEAAYETTQDLLIGGESTDVKTKDRTVRPRSFYECSVPLYNHDHQRPNNFVFISLQRDRGRTDARMDRFSRAFVLGWCTLEEVDRGVTWNEGETDPSNGTKFWTACKNVRIDELRPMQSLLQRYGKQRGST